MRRSICDFEIHSGTAKAVARRLQPSDTAPYASSYGRRLVTAGERFAENEKLRLSVHDDGTFEVTDKATGIAYRRTASFEDVGDVGDEYNYCPPDVDRRVTSADARVTKIARVSAGPLRASFRVELELPLPSAADPDRRRRASDTVAVPVSVEATLDAGSPRVVFGVSVDNRARDHRLRILFPPARRTSRRRGRIPHSTSSHGPRGCRCRRPSGTNRRSAARR